MCSLCKPLLVFSTSFAVLTAVATAPTAHAIDMPNANSSYNAANGITNHQFVRREAILHYTNAIRSVHGMRPVVHNPELDVIAQDWAQHSANIDYLDHRPRHWEVYPAHIPAGGENALQGWDDFPSYKLVYMWFNSPSHRKILLDPSAKSLGIGVAVAPDGKLFAVQNFGR